MAKQVESAGAGGAAAGAAGGSEGAQSSVAGVSALTARAGIDQAGDSQEVVPFVSQVPGTPVSFPSFHGRPVSWVAVSMIMAGFLCGGLALVFGPTWWAFWLGIGITVVGGLLAMATGIIDDWY